jgi:hypothetical protein
MGGGGGTLIFVNNLSTCVYQGHQVKTRAPWNFIIGNRLLDCDNTTASIQRGTYDPATGKVRLTISQPLHMVPEDQITVVTATGAGSVGSLLGTHTEGAGSGGTTVNFTVATGLTMTITGGTVSDNWGASGHILDIPNGTNADIENNVFRRGRNAATAIFIHHAGEVPNPIRENDMIVSNNTVVADYPPGAQFLWEQGTNASGAFIRSAITGNTFYGLDPGGTWWTGQPGNQNVPYIPLNTYLPIGKAPAISYATPASCAAPTPVPRGAQQGSPAAGGGPGHAGPAE